MGPGGLAAGLCGDEALARLFGPDAEIAAMLRFERELAAAQGALGLIPGEAALAIGRALADRHPSPDALREGMVRDGVPVPALAAMLRETVGEPHGRHLHFGATSQDAVDTGLMLRLKEALELLAARTGEVEAILAGVRDAQGARSLMAHTRMQAALAFTVGDKIDSWAVPLGAHRERLAALAEALPIQLGGPVGNGGSFGASYGRLRAELARRLALRDAAPWHADRTVILDAAQALAVLTGTLGKIGQDVALLAQSERDAVRLAGVGGSSAMAHKRNPVAAEILVALARWNAGLLGTLGQSMVHENERSGAAWTLEWFALPQMAEAAGAALGHAARLLDGIEFAGG